MMEVKFWRDIVSHAGEMADALRAGKLNSAFVESRIDGIPPSFTPKPFHGMFMAIFSMATGIRDEWIGCLWSACAGAISIAIIGLWTSAHFGAMTGSLAALLLAVSRSHVMYSRSQLAEADAILFFLIAACFHANRVIRMRRDAGPGIDADTRVILPAIGMGALYGLAIAVNYRCLLFIPIVWLWDIATARGAIKRLAWMAAGIAVILCFIELPYRIYIWKAGALPAGMKTYFEGFWSRMFQDLPVGARRDTTFFAPHLGMARAYLFLDGYKWLIGLALGAWALFRSKTPALVLVAALAFAPIAVFSLVTRGDGPRAVSASIPFFSILTAVGLMELLKPAGAGRSLVAVIAARAGMVLVAAMMIESFFRSVWATELQTRSAWPETGRWLVEQPRERVITTFPLAARFYLRKDLAELPPQGDTAAITPGIWVIDRYNAAYAYPYPVVKKVISSYNPERVFEGDVYPNTGLFLDWGVFMRSPDWRAELARENMGRIEIYRVPEEPSRDTGPDV